MEKEQNSFASTEASSCQNLSMSINVPGQPALRRPPRRSYGRGRACVAY